MELGLDLRAAITHFCLNQATRANKGRSAARKDALPDEVFLRLKGALFFGPGFKVTRNKLLFRDNLQELLAAAVPGVLESLLPIASQFCISLICLAQSSCLIPPPTALLQAFTQYSDNLGLTAHLQPNTLQTTASLKFASFDYLCRSAMPHGTPCSCDTSISLAYCTCRGQASGAYLQALAHPLSHRAGQEHPL